MVMIMINDDQNDGMGDDETVILTMVIAIDNTWKGKMERKWGLSGGIGNDWCEFNGEWKK